MVIPALMSKLTMPHQSPASRRDQISRENEMNYLFTPANSTLLD